MADRTMLTAEQFREMVSAGMGLLFDVSRLEQVEKADAEIDQAKRLEARRAIVKDGFVWFDRSASPAEIDALYAFLREAVRLKVARSTGSFRARYGIALSCGEAPDVD